MSVRSVERSVDLLTCVGEAPNGRSLTELSNVTGINVPTAHRILNTLAAKELLYYDRATHLYYVGATIFRMQLSNCLLYRLKTLFYDHLLSLRDQTMETVSLVVARGAQRVTIDALHGLHELNVTPRIGEAFAIDLGAAGKILLAHTEPSVRETLLTRLQSKAALDRGTRARLENELSDIRSGALATGYQEAKEGQWAIAGPIFQGTALLGALNICAPMARFSPDAEAAHKERLEACLSAIKETLQKSVSTGQNRDASGSTHPTSSVTCA